MRYVLHTARSEIIKVKIRKLSACAHYSVLLDLVSSAHFARYDTENTLPIQHARDIHVNILRGYVNIELRPI